MFFTVKSFLANFTYPLAVKTTILPTVPSSRERPKNGKNSETGKV